MKSNRSSKRTCGNGWTKQIHRTTSLPHKKSSLKSFSLSGTQFRKGRKMNNLVLRPLTLVTGPYLQLPNPKPPLWSVKTFPEQRQSPDVQVKLARQFVRYVNMGQKIFVVTHSDYIIQEVNNLLMLGQDFDGKDAFLKQYPEYDDSDLFIKPEQVVIYCYNHDYYETCTPETCPQNQYGIEVPYLSKTISELNTVKNLLAMYLDCQDEKGE